ncbi:hypothetical protein GJ496_006419 [Pomphorhynchus laevis]|nr:hypothetical protein GJ496_006419 [Pomphorhynchus laevis]
MDEYDDIDNLLEEEVEIQNEIKSMQLKRSFAEDCSSTIIDTMECFGKVLCVDNEDTVATLTRKNKFSKTIPDSLNILPVTSIYGDRLYLEFIDFNNCILSAKQWRTPNNRLVLSNDGITTQQNYSSTDIFQPTQTSNSAVNSLQWIDKYRPSRFADLLSDATVNTSHYVYLQHTCCKQT